VCAKGEKRETDRQANMWIDERKRDRLTGKQDLRLLGRSLVPMDISISRLRKTMPLFGCNPCLGA